MSYLLKVLVVTSVSLVLHLALGWAWTLAAGVAAGLWVGHGGWHLGSTSVGTGWLILIIYDFGVDARAVKLMTQTVGSILGNMPFLVIVALTLLIGALLGAVGGAAGTQLNMLIRSDKTVLNPE